MVEIVGCTDSIDELTTDHKYVYRKEGACGGKRRKFSILVISFLFPPLEHTAFQCLNVGNLSMAIDLYDDQSTTVGQSRRKTGNYKHQNYVTNRLIFKSF